MALEVDHTHAVGTHREVHASRIALDQYMQPGRLELRVADVVETRMGDIELGVDIVHQWMVRQRARVLDNWPRRFARLPRITEDGARRSLTDLLDNLTAVSEPKQLAQVMGTSLLAWGFFWGFFYATLLALGEGFQPADRLAVSFGALALSPPSAPTQPGIFHASVVVPLAAVGFDEVALTAYAVLLHILEMVWMIGLALWGLVQTGVSIGAVLEQNRVTDS